MSMSIRVSGGSVMKHLGLFEGIGGFSLAARWAGWETVAWCEWNEFGQRVLRHHFPEAEGHGDIKKTDFTKYANRIDVITGGFPCQPYSSAGKRKGKEDERHLWPEMLRVIREVQPSYVVGENVRGLTNWNGGLVFDEVQADLEAEGYEVLPFLLPACAVNAPHRRDRIWFIAKNSMRSGCLHGESEQKGAEFRQQWNTSTGGADGVYLSEGTSTDTNNNGHDGSENRQGNRKGNDNHKAWEKSVEQFERCGSEAAREITTDTNNKRLQGSEDIRGFRSCGTESHKQPSRFIQPNWDNFPTQPPICGGNDGIPRELDSITFPKWRNESIKAYGNAIVPQIAFQIFKVINKISNQ